MIVFFCVIIDYAMDNEYSQKTTTSIAIVAIIAALALLGIVAITIVTIPLQQEAEAAKSVTGQCASTIKNSSAPFCPKP